MKIATYNGMWDCLKAPRSLVIDIPPAASKNNVKLNSGNVYQIFGD